MFVNRCYSRPEVGETYRKKQILEPKLFENFGTGTEPKPVSALNIIKTGTGIRADIFEQSYFRLFWVPIRDGI